VDLFYIGDQLIAESSDVRTVTSDKEIEVEPHSL
jgi:hypothetical protein